LTYGHFQLHQTRDEQGRSAAGRARERGETVPAAVDYELPAELLEAATVAVVHDEVEGLNFYRVFGVVEAAFTDPELAKDREHRRAVLHYLKDPSVSPQPTRRLAGRDPARASRVFGTVLKRPGFSWERDGEALLGDRPARWAGRRGRSGRRGSEDDSGIR